MKYFSTIFLLLSIFTFPLSCTQLPQKELVVVVHGVWFPLMSHYVHKMGCPKGLVKSTNLGQATLGKLADTLHASDSRLFHRDSIYNFGWSGKLSVAAREQAAQELYGLLLLIRGRRLL